MIDMRAPALIGGVSQQGPTRRLSTQVEAMDNAWASPVDGMRKRHPTEHLARVVEAPGTREAKLHAIHRGDEEYLVLAQPGLLQVFGTDGAEYPVRGPSAPFDPDFTYIDTRSGAQLLTNPETFDGPNWSRLEDATVPQATTIPAPLGFGSAARLGHANQTVGFDGIYQHATPGTSQSARKHLSVYVRAPDVAGPVAGIRLVIHETAPASVSYEAAWLFTDGVPSQSSPGSPGVQAREVDAGEGWWRLEMTYQPDGVALSTVDFIRIELLAQGVLGPDHLLDCWGAQFADTDLRTFENYPPYLRGGIAGVAQHVRMTTVQDTTWLVNGTTTVRRGAGQSGGQVVPANQRVVWVRQGGALKLYTVRVKTSLGPVIEKSVFTGSVQQFSDSTAPAGGFPTGIFWQLGINVEAIGGSETQIIAAALSELLKAEPSIDAEVHGSLLVINPTDPNDFFQQFTLEDGLGSQAMQLVTDEVKTLDDLPTTYYHGQKALVIGTSSGTEDDYWVEFRADQGTGIGAGQWHESNAPLIDIELDAATMPHVLLRKFDDGAGSASGTPGGIYFEFGPFEWGDRLTGDDESNPFPSFVTPPGEANRFIVDVFYFKDRLGLLSAANVIMSEVGKYGRFFRSTILSLPDSDPIDALAAHRKVNKLIAAVPFEGRLLAFSENSIFAVGGDPILSPRTVEMPAVHESDVLTTLVPATSGASVLWCAPSRGFSLLREGFVPGDSASGFVLRRNDLAEQAPTYVRGNVLDLVASSIENEMVVAMRADADLSVLYIYKAHVTGGRRVQSAWWRYPLDGARLIGLDWIEDRLYLAIERNRELDLEVMRMISGALDDDSELQVCLDRRVSDADLSPVYDPLERETTLTLPYTLSDESLARVVTRAVPGAEGGEPLAIARTTPTSIVIEGDHSETPLWAGQAYSMVVKPGEQIVSTEARDGSIAPHLRGGRLLLGGAFGLRGPIHLDLRVTDRFGGGSQLEPLRDEIGPGAPFGEVQRYPRIREFSVLADPAETVVTIEAHSHLATHIDALEWRMNAQGG
jgi:hypothetical protein